MVCSREGDRVNYVSASALLEACVGRVVSRIDRVFYVRGQEVQRDVGAVELIFDGGEVLSLDVGSDGESLRVESTPWVDEFEQHPAEENLMFVRTHGKWTRFLVSDASPYREFTGRIVDRVDTVLSPSGKLIGAIFWVAGHVLRIDVEADDLYVQVT